MDLFRFVIFLLALLWLGWFLMGGPQGRRIGSPFLSPPAPLGTGESYGPGIAPNPSAGEGTDGGAEEETADKKSIFGGAVSIYAGNARTSNAAEEYVEIYASPANTQPINITGWKLKSAITSTEAEIGTGVYLPFGETVNTEEKIFLNPGDRAFVTTGESPRGISFKVNMCTGYFEQFQDFYPTLSKGCPYQSDEDLPLTGPDKLDDTCISYLETLPQCEAHVKAVPIGLSAACSDYINRNVHYRGCIEKHKDERDFYKNEWRIFLKKENELWKERRETIKLIDSEGKIVDSVSY